jgi:hypothetical protein
MICRRNFLQSTIVEACSLIVPAPLLASQSTSHSADLAILGASLGGCAAALTALRNGLRVVMT